MPNVESMLLTSSLYGPQMVVAFINVKALWKYTKFLMAVALDLELLWYVVLQ